MSKIRLNIDGLEVTGFEGQTILDIARENGVDIPTLCHDDRVEMYGSCGLCVVEAEGNMKLLRSCSTLAADGMIINTNTERVRSSRRTALELLLSDHTGDCRPPCTLACPAQTDCQGYAGLIANGEYNEAVKLIMDKIPLPSSIGRICPHPCEEACRRKLVEEPVSIAVLKQFAGDFNLEQGEPYTAGAGVSTDKNVAVIGGGPGGLTAAYFLRTQGHGVTVYDAMPNMGGMLQYGVPEYRLPKKILQAEIGAIEKMGVKFRNGVKIGRDITLDCLRNTHDAIIVAVGAWKNVNLGCPGENLDGVSGAVDFLGNISNYAFAGRRVAVVGGGDIAMDACRTSVRLGAGAVYNIYRRTKNEMPANTVEITEAEEEGVIFKNLTNPIEIIGRDGKVEAVRLQIMELGEPDASGRRSPVPVPGKEEILEVDAVIIAIGQKLDNYGFEQLELTRRGTIISDEHTFRTNLDGVFAVGDAVNKGADIAIAAIGGAKKAAESVNKYLNGEQLKYEPEYLVKTEKTAAEFADKEKISRIRTSCRQAGERRKDFLEVSPGFTEAEAKKEASRCLECGCADYFECKLIDYANKYKVQPEKYAGEAHHRVTDNKHPFILRNPDKCILCGLCVRICDEAVGAAALGFVDRGFGTVIKPALDMDLRDTDCISCGQCVDACPTGALTETVMAAKQVPVRERFTETVCSFCSVGCKTKLATKGNLILRSLPVSERPETDALLCVKGRFGFGEIAKKERLTAPLIRGENGMKKIAFEEAIEYANKNLQKLQAEYGGDCVAVSISDRYTNEEAYLIREYAEKGLKTTKIFSFGRTESGLADVLGRDCSTADMSGLENTELIVVIDQGNIIKNHGVAGMRIKRAVNKGAKVLLLSYDLSERNFFDGVASLRVATGDNLSVMRQIIRILLDSGCGKGIDGIDELRASPDDVSISDEARKSSDMILKARKAVFIFEKNAVTAQAARLIADIAVLSGHNGKPRDGIIQLLPGANSQGLSNLGVGSGEELIRSVSRGEIRGLFIFGEDIKEIDAGAVDFLAVQDLHMTETAKRANVVFPASAFSEVSGSFTGADGKARRLNPAVACPIELDNAAQIKALADNLGIRITGGAGKFAEYSTPRESDKIRPASASPAEGDVMRRGAYSDTNELCVNLWKTL